MIFAVRRIGQALLIMAVMMTIVFVATNFIGNPVDTLISPMATADDRARAIAELGLDQPLWRQYLVYWSNVLKGELGNSFVYSRPALQVIVERMPATLELCVVAMIMAVAVGLPLGLVAGLWHDRWFSKTIMALSVVTFSLPIFWVSLMLILFFSVELDWLPSTGRGETVTVLGMRLSVFTGSGLAHIIMPALSLAFFNMSMVLRLTRAGVREAVSMDYFKFARAKGLAPTRLVGVHVLKSILVPLITVVGLEFGTTVAAAVVTESIFGWPGMGKLIIDSINVLDRPMIIAYLLIMVTVFVTVNLIVDLLYAVLDPRVRAEA